MLQTAAFLATLNKILIDALTRPITEKYPNLDMWWLFYVALITGSLLGWFSEVNLVAEYIPNVLLGRILSSLLIGGGSTLIHEVFNEGVKLMRAKRVFG